MCDDTTEAENHDYLEELRLSRREAGVGAGAAFAAILAGCSTAPVPAAGSDPTSATQAPTTEPSTGSPKSAAGAGQETTSRMVSIDTPDGAAEAFFVAPKTGKHPAVIMWPDVAGLRDAYRTMATRLASAGYAVVAVNPYYRSAKMPVLTTFAEWRTDAGKEKIRPMREALTPEAITKDGAAFAGWLDQQKEVDPTRKIATTGYCMGGPFTFRTAAAAPQRVGVIGSFHGGGLVSDDPSSPHALLPKMKAAALICIAKNDDERAPEDKTTLRKAAAAANITAEIDVYPANHGWCTIDSPVYDKAQAERAWAAMLAMFARHL